MPAGFSDAGDRAAQEDVWHVARREGAALAIVCDAMGGGWSGRPAAELAVAYVAEAFKSAHVGDGGAELLRAIERANREIRDRADAAKERVPGAELCWNGMGTTCDAVLFAGGRALVAHVGDGRVYHRPYGRRHVERVTTDHTLINEYRFASAHLPPAELEALLETVPRNVIMRALGMLMDVKIDRHDVSTAPGDIFLLCSDGIFDSLDDPTIDAILDESRYEDEAARALVLAAVACPLRSGDHHDNTTAVVHFVGDDGL